MTRPMMVAEPSSDGKYPILSQAANTAYHRPNFRCRPSLDDEMRLKALCGIGINYACLIASPRTTPPTIRRVGFTGNGGPRCRPECPREIA